MAYVLKIRHVGAKLFHRRTDMTKQIAAFRNFANVPKVTISSAQNLFVVLWDIVAMKIQCVVFWIDTV